MSHTVAATSSPVLWQTSKTSIKKLTSISPLALWRIELLSSWLLPLVMEMTKNEDQGLICSTPCHAVASEVVKALKTVKLLIETKVLSD